MGMCKLTQTRGKFTRSHILPKALTRAEGLAPGLTQYGQGKAERRSSSWYDPAMVTEAGEKILSNYDDWGIKTLREYKMVWSGWGPMESLSDVRFIPGTPWGQRKIEFRDVEVPRRLRLFLLSILWRAAATVRSEFAEITLSSEHLEKLRAMVLKEEPEPLDFYPATLVQLSTLGTRHNMAPIASTKQIPPVGEKAGWNEPIFRFMIDGLIIHFSRLSIEENAAKDLGRLRVGNGNALTLNTVRYEDSAEAQNMEIVMLEAALGRPLFEISGGAFPPT